MSAEFEPLPIPVTIGLVADTHRSSRAPRALPAEMLRGLEGVDFILHAGDLCAPWVLDTLSEIAPARAVRGNNEEPPLDAQLPVTLWFQAWNWSLAVRHGDHHRLPAREAIHRDLAGKVDCAIYGHSHCPEVMMRGGLLMVNPGSPTQRRFAPNRSYAIMRVAEEIDVNLVPLD